MDPEVVSTPSHPPVLVVPMLKLTGPPVLVRVNGSVAGAGPVSTNVNESALLLAVKVCGWPMINWTGMTALGVSAFWKVRLICPLYVLAGKVVLPAAT